jgi:REP element-mobilizing transposase RayT
MSELRKANTDYPYFVTLSIVGWIDLFTRSRYAELIEDNLNHCIQHKGLSVYAYVIMPSHIHIVARQEEGKLNEVLRTSIARLFPTLRYGIRDPSDDYFPVSGGSKYQKLFHKIRSPSQSGAVLVFLI